MRNINRRQFLKQFAGGVAAASLTGCGSELVKKTQGRGKRPNIIFLLTDDQRWDTLGAMGNPIIHTPNMDELASEGVLFLNAFVTTSICCTSRASIFCGQYARRHGIYDFATAFTPSQWAGTYPALLRGGGYRTGFVGKLGVGKAEDMPVAEFDFCKGIAGQPKYEQTDENGKYKHLTRIMGEQSLEFLRSCSPDKPFCLSVSFKAPHVQDQDPRQFIYDPAYKDLYKHVTIPVPETAAPVYFRALPKFLQNSEARRRWEMRFSTPEKYQESVKGYYRLITGVDVVIGRIRRELEVLGMADNTVIILTGDNGFYLGEHGLAGKWFPHEESIRVPLVVFDGRADGRCRGLRPREMVLNIDIAPTILELAGLDVPGQMQGRSLVPLLRGGRPKWRQEFFYEHLFDHPTIAKSEAVRTSRWKYSRYIDRQPVYEELYDLANDPQERTNLVNRKDYEGVLSLLRKHWQTQRQQAG